MRSDIERLEEISLEIDKMIYQRQCELATRNSARNFDISFEIPEIAFDIYNHEIVREILRLKELKRYVAVTIFELKEKSNEH